MSNTSTKSQLIIPLDKNLKSEVKVILEELGLNQSQVVVSLFKQIARTKKVPLSFDLNDRDETEYLLSSRNNKQILLDSIQQAERKNYKSYTLIGE